MITPDSARMCPKSKAQLSTGEYVSGINHTVVLKARDDLFDPTTGDEIVCDDGKVLPGLQICVHNEVTAIPDNVGCCEVVSVGSEVQNVKPGDVVFIDFFDVRQGAVLGDPETLKGIELYIANDDAFKAFFDPKTFAVTPMPGYLITKQAKERMQIAINGTDRIHVAPVTLENGIISGRTKEGTPYAFVVYEEVISIGLPETESKLRPMTKAERALLDFKMNTPYFGTADYEGDECKLENAVRSERESKRPIDVAPGDLVAYSTDFSVQIRVKGQFMKIVSQSALLCVFDDEKMLNDAIRAGKAGCLSLVK